MFEDALPEKLKTILKKITLRMDQEKFYLAGGTGLALQIGHRISEDLDFFRAIPFDENMLTSLLKQGISSFEEIMAEKHTLWVILDGVRCSFFFYEVPLLFPPIPYEGLKVADWRDIIAEKFKTISQRGSKKDFFDVFAVVRSKMRVSRASLLTLIAPVPASAPNCFRIASMAFTCSGLPVAMMRPVFASPITCASAGSVSIRSLHWSL